MRTFCLKNRKFSFLDYIGFSQDLEGKVAILHSFVLT